MEISFVSKNKSVQPQKVQDPATDPVRNVSTEENKKYVNKNKVDKAEISSSYSGSFEDKRIMVAKSNIVYEASLDTSNVKVEELKEKIEKGEYDVPANLIADAILK
jgi:anti-sigma28 factor (negative regulator of flagellin synthesis)